MERKFTLCCESAATCKRCLLARTFSNFLKQPAIPLRQLQLPGTSVNKPLNKEKSVWEWYSFSYSFKSKLETDKMIEILKWSLPRNDIYYCSEHFEVLTWNWLQCPWHDPIKKSFLWGFGQKVTPQWTKFNNPILRALPI